MRTAVEKRLMVKVVKRMQHRKPLWIVPISPLASAFQPWALYEEFMEALTRSFCLPSHLFGDHREYQPAPPPIELPAPQG